MYSTNMMHSLVTTKYQGTWLTWNSLHQWPRFRVVASSCFVHKYRFKCSRIWLIIDENWFQSINQLILIALMTGIFLTCWLTIMKTRPLDGMNSKVYSINFSFKFSHCKCLAKPLWNKLQWLHLLPRMIKYNAAIHHYASGASWSCWRRRDAS